MTTFKEFPGPILCDYWTREATAAHYDDGSSFQIGRIDMIANTGTYVDSPFHRYADGADCPNCRWDRSPTSMRSSSANLMTKVSPPTPPTLKAAKCVGARCWSTPAGTHIGGPRPTSTNTPSSPPPPPTGWLQTAPPSSGSTATTSTTRAPAHVLSTALLAAGIPIGEHLTNLGAVPNRAFRFSAVPPKVKRMRTFPVRAHARVVA